MKSSEIKQILYDIGADLCGIAAIDRFEEAPEGFHPCDILPSCKSVIVFAKKMPAAVFHCKSTIPYTITRNLLAHELDRLSILFCEIMEQHGIIAVPTGTISPSRVDVNTGRMRGAVSAKHSAVAAGLGRIGKNTLLNTPEYGNMVWLNAALCAAELEPDSVLTGDPCPKGCTLCIDNCPVQALGNPEMDQNACRAHAFRDVPGEEWTFKCYMCRNICPRCFGSNNSNMKP